MTFVTCDIMTARLTSHRTQLSGKLGPDWSLLTTNPGQLSVINFVLIRTEERLSDWALLGPIVVRDKNSEASHVSSPLASVNRNIMGGTKISFLSPFVVIALCYGSGQYLWISPQGGGSWWLRSLISPYLCIHYNWTFDRYLWKHSDIWGEVYTIHFISPVGGNAIKLEGIQVSFYFNFRLLTDVEFVFLCIF